MRLGVLVWRFLRWIWSRFLREGGTFHLSDINIIEIYQLHLCRILKVMIGSIAYFRMFFLVSE